MSERGSGHEGEELVVRLVETISQRTNESACVLTQLEWLLEADRRSKGEHRRGQVVLTASDTLRCCRFFANSYSHSSHSLESRAFNNKQLALLNELSDLNGV